MYGAGATGLLFAPGAGVTDLMGYAPDPAQPGEYLPSFGENIREGNYLDAALQTLGGAGDVMMAGGALVPPLVGVGAAMKAPRAARVAQSAPASIRAYHGSPHDFAPAVRVLDTETGKTYVQEAGDPILTGLMAQNPGKYEIIEENPLGMFDLSKMGTGEGAQAYGEGAYLSGAEGIARGYRDALSRGRSSVLYKGEPVKSRYDTLPEELTEEEYILDSIATEMGNFDQKPENVIATKIRSLKAQIEEPSGAEIRLAESDEELRELQSLIRASAQRDLDVYESLDPKDFARGRMYEAEIRVGPEELLDYDEFLYDQTPDIKKRIKNLVESELTEMDAVNLGYDTGKDVDLKAAKEFMLRDDMTIDEFLGNWQALRGSSDAGEFLLNKYGIPGLKYKAGGSRAPGMDEADIDRNYVIFDENLINILRKYGLLAPLAGGGTAAAVMGADEPQPAGGIL
jgi:hypothetical protein